MKMTFFVPLVLAFYAATAQAETRSARLLSDAPQTLVGAGAVSASSLLGSTDLKTAPLPEVTFAVHFTKTTAVGMASSVVGVLLGAGLGSLSNNLVAAVIPVLLSNLFLPPVVTVLAAMLIGNWDSPGRFGFWLPLAGAFAVNAAAYVLASLAFVVPWTNPAALLLYTLVDGLLMSGASVGLMHLTEKRPATTVASFSPGITDTVLVPVMKVNL